MCILHHYFFLPSAHSFVVMSASGMFCAIQGIYISSETNFDDRFTGRSVKFSRLPGWEVNSWGYYGDDGHALSADKSGASYGPPFGSKLCPSVSQSIFFSKWRSWRCRRLWN